ncbi:MAG: hypothetical protein NDP23_06160 [Crenarchaeota archaeon]|nr:hypothetical protein [Thermoproteota archaeon]MCR8489115.1 hypothetical protein [Thermoproteota archaeon]
MEVIDIWKHYSNPEVRREIIDYARGRWLALYASTGGVNVFFRYWGKDKPPLSISDENDYLSMISKFKNYRFRTIYASVNVYRDLSRRESIDDKDNIIRTTPIWDIDGSLEGWKYVVEVARLIINYLEREGITKSVYLKWSGRGMHVHIHENAFSDEVLERYHPLDLAYATVEFVLRKLSSKIQEVAKAAPQADRPLKLENEIDVKRVFTVPLSLHKSLNLAAVCIKPGQIDEFTPDWARLDVLKHNKDWRLYEVGEADNLAIRAIKEVGGYFERVGEIRTVVGIQQPKKTVREVSKESVSVSVGRFQVMALLQAARYYLLTGDIQKAKSFGLNRAIFYAWAKYHRKPMPRKRFKPTIDVEEVVEEGKRMVYVGDEGAFVSERGWFIIGDKEQVPEDFDKNVASKINAIVEFEKAWQSALEYVRQFPKSVLLDQRRFYEDVYKSVRDNFIILVKDGKIPRRVQLDLR